MLVLYRSNLAFLISFWFFLIRFPESYWEIKTNKESGRLSFVSNQKLKIAWKMFFKLPSFWLQINSTKQDRSDKIRNYQLNNSKLKRLYSLFGFQWLVITVSDFKSFCVQRSNGEIWEICKFWFIQQTFKVISINKLVVDLLISPKAYLCEISSWISIDTLVEVLKKHHFGSLLVPRGLSILWKTNQKLNFKIYSRRCRCSHNSVEKREIISHQKILKKCERKFP